MNNEVIKRSRLRLRVAYFGQVKALQEFIIKDSKLTLCKCCGDDYALAKWFDDHYTLAYKDDYKYGAEVLYIVPKKDWDVYVSTDYCVVLETIKMIGYTDKQECHIPVKKVEHYKNIKR